LLSAPAPSRGSASSWSTPIWPAWQSATIEVFSSQGDREVLTLTALSPGRFRPTTFPVPLCGEALPPTPRNGKIEINFLAVPATLTFRYIDANPGANRPPATLMRSVTIR
jgi:hypothetical protein